MTATVDANVLVYASNESDPSHEPCRKLVAELAKGPDLFHLFWPSLMGYLRIATHPGILPRPLTPAAAESNVGSLLALPHTRVHGEDEGFFEIYQQTRTPPTRGNDVPDAHLAALMRQHGVRTIWTRDRDFLGFEGLDVRDPTGA